MINLVKSWLKRNFLIHELIAKRNYCKKLDLRTLSEEQFLEKLMDSYERNVGYRFDINTPMTYTEKLQWYKAFYTGGGKIISIVDKYLFKQYVKNQLGDGYTIPLFGAWTSLKDLERDWDALPEEFVLKSNLSSFGNNIKFIHHKSGVRFKDIKKELNEWLKPKNLLTNSYCKAYHTGIPRIIAEEYLENVKGQLYDYKFFCFDGEPFCCCVNTQHFEKGKEHTFPITYYDLDWNKIDVRSGIHETEDCVKPKHFDEMVEISRKLSKDFPHVRVDFFDTDKQLYLAEMTFFPGGGQFKYTPESFNVRMGELFNLPV